MSNCNEKFLLYMNDFHVIKPINSTISWLRKRNTTLCLFMSLMIKLSISCMFQDRYIDDWLGDYFWMYGKAGFLLQIYLINELILIICFELSVRHFEDDPSFRNMIDNISG